MSLMSSPALLWLRGVARKTGLNRLLGRYFAGDGYEARFAEALRAAVRDGDCIWDVGANRGWYTRQLSQWAGPRGHVYAFEPDPLNITRLGEAIAAIDNVTVLPLGLSDGNRQASMRPGDDRLHATSMIVPHADPADNRLETVALMSGAAVLQGGRAAPPNVIKIDVEGHEFEVLQGFGDGLRDPQLRSLFIEVHFGILSRQGRADVPARIERLLTGNGFNVGWLDPSHLHARR